MIISRTKELKALRSAREADESRFIAVYGRRRVGKTFLIREAYEYHFVFQHAGLSPQDGGKTKKAQLYAFAVSLKKIRSEKLQTAGKLDGGVQSAGRLDRSLGRTKKGNLFR